MVETVNLARLALVITCSACATIADPTSPPSQQRENSGAKSEVLPAPAPKASPEPTLGVVDRGVYSDLDGRLQLPPPGSGAEISALIDAEHRLLIVYADDWPHKVYPLGGSAELVVGSQRLLLRPGDRAELEGRLSSDRLRRLADHELPPPGDQDGDGIPDPLDILIGAHKAALDAASYDDGYFTIRYPNGDPPRDRGACVDVIVRAVRNAGTDIQAGVIEDERAAAGVYGVTRPDPNIDHRRVRNVIVYFKRHWVEKSARVDDPQDPLRPGDVVFLDTFASKPGPDHVGIVTQSKGKSGYPTLINLWTFGYKTQAMDLLGSVPVTHRFRFPSRR